MSAITVNCGVCGTDITNDEEPVQTDDFGTICAECNQAWTDYQDIDFSGLLLDK